MTHRFRLRLCLYGKRKAAGCLILFYAFDVSNFDLLSHLHASYVSSLHLLAKSWSQFPVCFCLWFRLGKICQGKVNNRNSISFSTTTRILPSSAPVASPLSCLSFKPSIKPWNIPPGHARWPAVKPWAGHTHGHNSQHKRWRKEFRTKKEHLELIQQSECSQPTIEFTLSQFSVLIVAHHIINLRQKWCSDPADPLRARGK